jgi:hypothetical protein
MQKNLFLFPLLWSLGLAACSAGSLDDTDSQGDSSEAEGAVVGPVLPPQRCERLQVKLTSQGASSGTTINVPGPYKASISADGKKMSCTGPTGDFIPSSFLEDFFKGPGPARFILNNNNTGLAFDTPLGPQQTTVKWSGTPLGPNTRDWTAPIKIISCHPYTAAISAPGFNEHKIDMIAELNGIPAQGGQTFRTGCRYRVKGPITITRDKPPEVTGASGDGFIFKKPPTICEGDDCQAPACPAERQCTAASQCGAPGRFTCTNGCCLTVIR